jgi:hypothetical protein
MASWFDELPERAKVRFREIASKGGKAGNVLAKARAGRLGAAARWKGHAKKEKTPNKMNL